MKRKDKCKAKTAGSIMVSAILAIFVWIGIAQSMAIIANSGFKSIKSGRTAIQAQQYADISIDRLKNINYDELDTAGAHTRAVISGLSTTDWEDEVTIGAESTIAGSDDVKQRIATVNVYKTGDTLPRYTVEVPLSSQGNNMKFPDWNNGIDLIPNLDFIAPCNGLIVLNADYSCGDLYEQGIAGDRSFFINNERVANLWIGCPAHNESVQVASFPVKKGTKIFYQNPKILHREAFIYKFYPYK